MTSSDSIHSDDNNRRMADIIGYEQAVGAVMTMSVQELMEYLDTMEGRLNLPRSCKLEDIRNEALAQTERKFSNMTEEDAERERARKKANFASALVPGRTQK